MAYARNFPTIPTVLAGELPSQDQELSAPTSPLHIIGRSASIEHGGDGIRRFRLDLRLTARLAGLDH